MSHADKKNTKAVIDESVLEHEDLVDKPKVDMDRILVEEIGQFSRYQLRLLLVSVLMITSLALTSSEYLFTAARIPTRCWIPECENASEPRVFKAEWMEMAVPSGDAGFDQCKRFAVHNTSAGYCSATLFDRNATEPCEAYVYENTNTVVYDFKLACDEWRRAMIGSVRTLGALVAQPVTGLVSDRWGRRHALALNYFNAVWIGLARYWATTHHSFLFAEFFEGALGAGSYTCIYILIMESVGPKYRVVAAATFSTFFSLGHILLAAIVWNIPHWRDLTVALYSCQLMTLSLLTQVPESIRWYITKGQFEKSAKIIKNIARVNGKLLSEKSLIMLRETTEENKKVILKDGYSPEPWLIVQIYRHKPILLRCLVSPICWISLTFIYYGMTINSIDLKIGNKYFNFLSISFAEIAGYWTACALVNRIGRKPVLAGGYWICALAQIGYLLTPNGFPRISLTIYMVGKWSISVVVTSLYVYTSELYPTRFRHSLVAFSSMTGRVGAILAPLTSALNGNMVFMVYAALGVVSGALVLTTPETLGTKLPDTMEEAAHIGRERRPDNL